MGLANEFFRPIISFPNVFVQLHMVVSLIRKQRYQFLHGRCGNCSTKFQGWFPMKPTSVEARTISVPWWFLYKSILFCCKSHARDRCGKPRERGLLTYGELRGLAGFRAIWFSPVSQHIRNQIRHVLPCLLSGPSYGFQSRPKQRSAKCREKTQSRPCRYSSSSLRAEKSSQQIGSYFKVRSAHCLAFWACWTDLGGWCCSWDCYWFWRSPCEHRSCFHVVAWRHELFLPSVGGSEALRPSPSRPFCRDLRALFICRLLVRTPKICSNWNHSMLI